MTTFHNNTFHNRSLEDPFLLLHPSIYFFQTPTHQHFVKQLVPGFWETRFQKKLPVDYPILPWNFTSTTWATRSFRSLNASPICGLRCHGQNRALWVFGRMLDVLPSRMCEMQFQKVVSIQPLKSRHNNIICFNYLKCSRVRQTRHQNFHPSSKPSSRHWKVCRVLWKSVDWIGLFWSFKIF